MAQIIHAQFMHQHKDKVVYEREILVDSLVLRHYSAMSKPYLEFDTPVHIEIEPEFIKLWFITDEYYRPGGWKLMPMLEANVDKPQVIAEKGYTE